MRYLKLLRKIWFQIIAVSQRLETDLKKKQIRARWSGEEKEMEKNEDEKSNTYKTKQTAPILNGNCAI